LWSRSFVAERLEAEVMDEDQLWVGVIGCGAIGSVVADALHRGDVPGATLVGVCTRSPVDTPVGSSLGIDALIERSDLIVECASHSAVVAHGARILSAGVDLLVTSIGALADDELHACLRTTGPGRLLLSTGALGGVDLLRAAALGGPVDAVHLTTTKAPLVLVQDWMDDAMVEQLRAGDRRVVVFDGPAREAATRFPRSANVAAALSLAAGGWDRVAVRLVADPTAEVTTHHIEFEGVVGRFATTVENRPDPSNPASSAIVPFAVLRAIGDEAAASWRFQ
jgi:aspartate dehydrogenase